MNFPIRCFYNRCATVGVINCTFFIVSCISNIRIWFQSTSDYIFQQTFHKLYQSTLTFSWHSYTKLTHGPWHKPHFTHPTLYTPWHPSKNTSLLTRNTLTHTLIHRHFITWHASPWHAHTCTHPHTSKAVGCKALSLSTPESIDQSN